MTDRFHLHGVPNAIVLGDDGVEHPISPNGRGHTYTPYTEITQVLASPRTVFIGARGSVYPLSRRAFVDPHGPDELVRALLLRVRNLPDGEERLFRMGELGARALVTSRPWATWTLAAACLLMLPLQLLLGASLEMAGAFIPILVQDGDLWRIVTATLLHGLPSFPVHLALNLVALVALGTLVERPLGSRRTTIVMAISAVAAMGASAMAGYDRVVGVSGVVFGLAGAAMWLELRCSEQLPVWLRIPRRAFVVLLLVNAGIMTLVPFIAGAAHVGGFIAGFLVTGALTGRNLPVGRDPVWLRAATVAVTVWVVVSLGAAAAEFGGRGSYLARYAERLARLPGVSPGELNDQAWMIAIAPDSTREEFEAALVLAERAVVETERSIPGILDTLAEVQFQLGWNDQAIATIDEAIAQAPNVSYYLEQRRRFSGERDADDRPADPLPWARPPPAPEPRHEPGVTV
jgi:membrane associated rhomboid family serine protease